MRLPPVALLLLAPHLGHIHTSITPDDEHRTLELGFARLPPEINNAIFSKVDLVAYAAVLNLSGNVPLITSEVELQLLSESAAELEDLDIGDKGQLARLLLRLSAVRTVINRRSGLPTTVDPHHTDESTLKQLAATLTAVFDECNALATFPIWSGTCLAALLGKNTLVTLLPFFSEGPLYQNPYLMLKAAVLVGDLETLNGIAHYFGISRGELSKLIDHDYIIFSDNIEFARKMLSLIPGLISQWHYSLALAINFNHRPLYEHLYAESTRHLERRKMKKRIREAFKAAAMHGWLDVFKQLHSDYPEWLATQECLCLAAVNNHLKVLEYLLFHPDHIVAKRAKAQIVTLFDAAVRESDIETIEFLLSKDKDGNFIFPELGLLQPSATLERLVYRSRLDTIEYLVRKKTEGDSRFAAVESVDTNEKMLVAACRLGNAQLFQYLLQKDAHGQFMLPRTNSAAEDYQLLVHACYSGSLSIVQELLRIFEDGNHIHRDINPMFEDAEPLVAACTKGHLAVVQELLRKKDDGSHVHQWIDPAARENLPLCRACANGRLAIVKELLRKKEDESYFYSTVDPAAQNNGPLFEACVHGHLNVVKELLRKK